jgi:hypothetical protein
MSFDMELVLPIDIRALISVSWRGAAHRTNATFGSYRLPMQGKPEVGSASLAWYGLSVDPFNVRHLPALLEERLLGAIEAKPREPFLTSRGVFNS